jgi:hypothetical protein
MARVKLANVILGLSRKSVNDPISPNNEALATMGFHAQPRSKGPLNGFRGCALHPPPVGLVDAQCRKRRTGC